LIEVLGTAHKRRDAVRGMAGFVQCGYFSDKEVSSDADVRNFWRKKTNFSKFMVCPHGQGGRGVNFCDFVRTSFMNGPLYKKNGFGMRFLQMLRIWKLKVFLKE